MKRFFTRRKMFVILSGAVLGLVLGMAFTWAVGKYCSSLGIRILTALPSVYIVDAIAVTRSTSEALLNNDAFIAGVNGGVGFIICGFMSAATCLVVHLARTTEHG